MKKIGLCIGLAILARVLVIWLAIPVGCKAADTNKPVTEADINRLVDEKTTLMRRDFIAALQALDTNSPPWRITTEITNEVQLIRTLAEVRVIPVSNVWQTYWWKSEGGQWFTNRQKLSQNQIEGVRTNIVEVK